MPSPAKLGGLPDLLCRSLTWDQGSELAAWADIRIENDIDVWFCDPHAPWQRGTNENTNGLLRQYFPKGTDLHRHSRDDLDAVALALNTRPRKTLGWKTPAEALDQLLQSHFSPVLRPPVEPKQFRSKRYQRTLRAHGLVGSMGRVSSAGDNAAMESFFSLLQNNVLDRQSWATRDELHVAIITWIERTYHRRRRQRALGKLTPVEFETVIGNTDLTQAA
jgi:transposase InsO family protein